MSLQEMLPFFIPLAIVELVLLFYTLWHIFTHTHYKRGTRLMWCIIAIVGMQFIGPVLYWEKWCREDDNHADDCRASKAGPWRNPSQR